MVLRNLKKNKAIVSIVLFFFVLKILTISAYKIIWWDAGVYITMGKYIYSLGNAGLWEYTRPIVWPSILGFFWKIGLDIILSGRIIEIAFGGLCILLTYKIAEKLFDRKTALLSALFLAFSPTFFFFNGIMLTEIVSTFFALLGLCLFIDKNYIISGFFFGISFLTRFLQFFIFISLFLIILLYRNKKNIRNLLKVSVGFAVVLLPYLALNQALYNYFLFPFTQHLLITKNSGWLNYHPLKFYFIELFRENLFYLLSILGIILAFKSKDFNKKIISFAFLIAFMFFNLINQKEMRFLIIIMPYMYILVSSSIFYLFNRLKNKFYNGIFIIVIASSLIFSGYNVHALYQKESAKQSHYPALESKFGDANGKIWVSNPIIAASSDKKINRLIYYPFFSRDKREELTGGISNADFVFLDLCDLGCRPDDMECENEKGILISSLKQELKTDYHSKNYGCWQYVFKK